MAIRSTPLCPRIGSQVHLDAASMLSGDHARAIRDLLEQRGVLVFRDVGFDDEELQAFAASIGTLNEEDGERGLFKVTLEPQENVSAYVLFGTRAWHMDRLDTELPPRGTILCPRVLPEVGGETEFANTYAAYEDLPDEDKQLIEDLFAEHRTEWIFRAVKVDADIDVQTVEAFHKPGRLQPMVWKHQSGRRSLVLGWTAGRIEGMDEAEGDALLRRLIAHAERPEYVYRHHWRMGDVVIWDNTGTMHRVRPFDRNSGRRLHRVTLVGEEPVTAA